jgi:hypothetical protein
MKFYFEMATYFILTLWCFLTSFKCLFPSASAKYFSEVNSIFFLDKLIKKDRVEKNKFFYAMVGISFAWDTIMGLFILILILYH